MRSEVGKEAMLLSPLRVRGVVLPNRAVLAPMQMYQAVGGAVQDWHVHHLVKFAVGGFGTVFTEALAVEERGRNTYGDLGVWSEAHVPGLRRLADAIRAHGGVPAAQLWHAGPKAARQRPWEGYGPLGAAEAARGETAWEPVAASADAKVEGWHPPRALSEAEVAAVVDAFAAGARRCAEAGYDVLGVHAAHGYLVHSFYSPLSNDRADAYGGGRERRMRFALEVAEAVRANWPEEKPLFFRLSCTDDDPAGGWSLEDTLVLSRELGRRGVDVIDCSSGGVDVIDCSSGGIGAPPTLRPVARRPGFQVPYAERVRRETGLPTMAVGLIREARHAEAILRGGRADLICIAREALYNPHWTLQAAVELLGDAGYDLWPPQYGWWLRRRAHSIRLAEAEAETAADHGA